MPDDQLVGLPGRGDIMLFKPYHIEQIRSLQKTATRREWDRRQVKPGNIYIAATEMFTSDEEANCYIKVDDVYQQPLGEMTDEDAQKEGVYETLEEFKEGYEKVYGEGSWDPEKVVYVVEFEYWGCRRIRKSKHTLDEYSEVAQ